MSQQDLASKSGTTRHSIINWEKGEGDPGFQMVARMAAVLRVTFSVLGCKIGPEDVLKLPTPAEQLCFAFDQDHTFMAQVTIRPSQKSVRITTVAQLDQNLA
jgi:transcriptional regulator with XRE-family HTH domain